MAATLARETTRVGGGLPMLHRRVARPIYAYRKLSLSIAGLLARDMGAKRSGRCGSFD